MIRIEALTKAFLDGTHSTTVLDGLDLELAPGDFVALLGRSGSGKSTLLNCIAGIETPDSGRVYFDDVDITSLPDRDRTRLRRDRVGIVFQFFNLLPMISVIENVALPGLLRGGKRAEILERARELLHELGLADRASEMPDHLSGGEQQRVATARALINRPALLLADEPTGNLDAITAARTLDLLREVNEKHGVTVLMVTHSEEAAAAAKRVAWLTTGRIEWPPEPEPEPDAEPEVLAVEEESPPVESEPASESPPSASEDTPRVNIEIPTGGEAKKMRPSAKAAALFGGAQPPPPQDIDEIIDQLGESDAPSDPDDTP